MKEIKIIMVKISKKAFENLEKNQYIWENSFALCAIIHTGKFILLCI